MCSVFSHALYTVNDNVSDDNAASKWQLYRARVSEHTVGQKNELYQILLPERGKTTMKTKVISKIPQFYSRWPLYSGILCISGRRFKLAIKASSPLKTHS